MSNYLCICLPGLVTKLHFGVLPPITLRSKTSPRRNLFRMRQFYETYKDDKKVLPLVSQLSWPHHLIIMSQCKRPEEREFYMRLAAEQHWGKRELERQIAASLFQRMVLEPPKVSAMLKDLHPQAVVCFRDAYALEFLGLPTAHFVDLPPITLRSETAPRRSRTTVSRASTFPSDTLGTSIKNQSMNDAIMLR